MVKVPNRPPTPIEPRRPADVGIPPPSDACPRLEVEVVIVAGAVVREGDRLSTHIRGERVRLQREGQEVAWVHDQATVEQIKRCQEAGGLYGGLVAAAALDSAVIVLESHR